MNQENQPLTLRLTLQVTYEPTTTDAETFRTALWREVNHAINRGMLTGLPEAIVDEHSFEVIECMKAPSEDALEEFFNDRLENLQLDLDDVPRKLAQYGLMEPQAFIAEMTERMQDLNEEDGDEDAVEEPSTVSGSIGKHDWAIGPQCEDGFLVHVDDRPVSYRPTMEAAQSLVGNIILRLQRDGDYRLNDKPAGFMPPA